MNKEKNDEIDEVKKSQRRLAGDQILLSGIITLGCTIFAIGGALWILTVTVLDNLVPKDTSITLISNGTTTSFISNSTSINIVTKGTTILNLDLFNNITQIFLIFGLATIIISFSITLIFFSPRIKKTKNNFYCTGCSSSDPNPLPCDIHENKSSPI